MSFLRAALLLLIAIPVGAQSHFVQLTWGWNQGTGDPETGFHVLRSGVPGGPYATIATVAATTLTFFDANVISNNTYYYVVTAFNPAGDSFPTNEIMAVIPAQVQPHNPHIHVKGVSLQGITIR